MDNQKVLAQVLKNLSDRWEMTVSEVAEKLNKMSEDEVKNVLEMTKLFEKGGKLNYLLCLKNGGVADCGCGKKLKAQNGQMLPTPDYQNPYGPIGNSFTPLSESAPMTEEDYDAIVSRPPGLPSGWMRQNRRDRMHTRQFRKEARAERRENRGWDFGAEPQATSGAEARILNRQNGGEIQEPLPDLRYRENEVWVNDGSVDGMRHRIGNLRSAGNVSSFEPTKIGRGMGIPTQWEANGFESYVESPQDYLNRHKQFQERLKAENRVK